MNCFSASAARCCCRTSTSKTGRPTPSTRGRRCRPRETSRSSGSGRSWRASPRRSAAPCCSLPRRRPTSPSGALGASSLRRGRSTPSPSASSRAAQPPTPSRGPPRASTPSTSRPLRASSRCGSASRCCSLGCCYCKRPWGGGGGVFRCLIPSTLRPFGLMSSERALC